MKPRLALLLLTVTMMLLHISAASTGTIFAASSESAMPLPKELHLTDGVTPVYDDRNGNKLYDAAPQVVQVAGAEDGWDQLLTSGEKVWFQIQTADGYKWVQLQNPKFEETYYTYILLMNEESFYNSRTGRAKSAGTISPQVVKAVYIGQNDYLIETWQGYKWIRPKQSGISVVHHYGKNSSAGKWIHLRTVTPMFAIPDAGSPVAGLLSPQTVVAQATLNEEWYYIDTFEGKRWIHPNIGYPWDLRTQAANVALTENTPVYEHPDLQAQVLGTLGPQMVTVFEQGGGWLHIRSEWLGDAWIRKVHADADPAAYIPPAHVDPEPITGEWAGQQGKPGMHWRNFPFDLTLYVMNGDKIDPEQTFGQPAKIRFAIQNVSPDRLRLHPPAALEIEIYRQNNIEDGKQATLIWSGALPVLEAGLNSGESRKLEFEWDQKDSDGKQVPYGKYIVSIKLPATISYSKDDEGQQQLERQTAMPAILTTFLLQIGAPLEGGGATR